MMVPQKYWEKTQIGSVLDIFPGLMGEYLQKIEGPEIVRCQKFMPYIFWRWQFLRIPGSVEEWTPFEAISHFAKTEKWPDGGQFCCQPKLVIENDKVNISVNAEYQSFVEQPLLSGLDDGSLGDDFSKDRGLFAQSDWPTVERAAGSIREYLGGKLAVWRADDPFIGESYTSGEWESFWCGFMKKSGGPRGVGTDEVMDKHVLKVRHKFPDYGLTNEEMKVNRLHSEAEMAVFYSFWVMANQYVFFPLSVYLNLVGLGFLDEESFRLDLQDMLGNYYDDPLPIAAPATYFYLTDFGRRVFI